MAERTVERIMRNNRVFKDANEAIRGAADGHEHDLDQLPFLCECPVEHCFEIVRLTKDEYAAIREDSNLYFTAVGHEAAEKPVGRVVERKDGYIVVEKA